MNRSLTAVLCALVAASFLLTGVTIIANGESGDDSLLPAFSNQAQLDRYLKSANQYSSPFFDVSKGGNGVPTSTSEIGAARFSSTNIQVFGVDEMDLVKTDGQYLYLVSSDAVSIVKAYPPSQLGNISRIDAVSLGQDDVHICGIFLLSQELVIIFSVSDSYDSSRYWNSQAQRTMAAVFDISDVRQPRLEGNCGVSGHLLAARMMEDRVYLITQEYIFWAQGEVKLPSTYEEDSSIEAAVESVRYDPQCSNPSSFVNLFSFNTSTQETKCQTVVAGYLSVIYVSSSSIYLSFQNEGYALPVTALIAASQQQATTLFKLDINGLDISCVAKGEVTGRLLNQYSLDEKDGYLRVATTTSGAQPENGVFILDKHLDLVGSITGMAPSERIYSARFLGDMLYLVTFRQIDPLFAVDLSDMHHPQVLGELKIAGVSSYLHPFGSDRLIGIGFENSSVKISLFDISDPSQPLEVKSLLLENYSYSMAQYDPHAVLFDDLTGLLVIPIWEYNVMEYWSVRSVAYLFQVSPDGIVLRGSIDHGPRDLTSYMFSIQRAVFMDGFLYTISDSMVKVNSLADLSEQAALIYHQTSSISGGGGWEGKEGP